jgi:hypothetical protein
MKQREGGRSPPGGTVPRFRKRSVLLLSCLFLAGICIILCAGCIGTADTDNRTAGAEAGAPVPSDTERVSRAEALNSGLSTRNISPEAPEETAGLPEDPDEQFEATVTRLVDNASLAYEGAGKSVRATDIRIYNLITDPDLADPAYLGREKGVVVTLLYSPPSNKTADTLWGHEVDATRIAGALYTDDAADEIGMTAVLFRESSTKDARVKLVLTAEDAGQFPDVWENRSYIRMLDWSEAVVREGSGVSYYEDPETELESSRPGGLPDVHSVSYGRDTFMQFLEDSTVTVDGLAAAVETADAKNNSQELRSASEALISFTLDREERLNRMPISTDLWDVRGAYVTGLQEYRKAGATFWLAAGNPGTAESGKGAEYLAAGKASIDAAVKGATLRDGASGTTASPFPDALPLNVRYYYQDEQKANDISIKVEKWGVKKGYGYLKDDVQERVDAGYGYKFITVVVQVTHLGYRGGGTVDKILTPSPEKFTLYAGGRTYEHDTPDSFMETIGEPYASAYLDRKEMKEGVLIFKVPDAVVPDDAFVKVDLGGDEGTVVWSMET